MSAPDCFICGDDPSEHPNGGACQHGAGAIDACPCPRYVDESKAPDPPLVRLPVQALRDTYLATLDPTALPGDVDVEIFDPCRVGVYRCRWQPRYGYVRAEESGYNGTFLDVVARTLEKRFGLTKETTPEPPIAPGPVEAPREPAPEPPSPEEMLATIDFPRHVPGEPNAVTMARHNLTSGILLERKRTAARVAGLEAEIERVRADLRDALVESKDAQERAAELARALRAVGIDPGAVGAP